MRFDIIRRRRLLCLLLDFCSCRCLLLDLFVRLGRFWEVFGCISLHTSIYKFKKREELVTALTLPLLYEPSLKFIFDNINNIKVIFECTK